MATFTRRQILGSAAGMLLLSVSSVNAEPTAHAQFVAVRVWPASAYTRITLESSLPLKYTSFTLKKPERLVIDIGNARLNNVLETLPSKVLERDPYLQRIRVSQYRADVVRIVLDLKTLVDPQIFTLSPVADFQERLVIDLYPAMTGAADSDPLMALLQDYRHGEISSDGSTSVIARTNVPDNRVSVSSGGEADVLGDTIRDIMSQGQELKPINVPANKPSATSNKPAQVANNKKGKRKVVVVLDPGHGGEDPGAIGPSGLYEKTVVLAIARECKKILESKGYKVHMTRNEDVFIPLRVRVAKARAVKADVFVSIHADAFSNPSARGTGVYALSRKGASSAAAKYLASTQNASDAIGGVSRVGDKMIDSTLFDLTQTATINDGLKLGRYVLDRLGKINKLHKSHVDQAAFAVLKAPDIPSILIETAFISNPEEERLLTNNNFRVKCAQAIADGVQDFVKVSVLKRIG